MLHTGVAVISKQVLAKNSTLPVQETPARITAGRKQIISPGSELPTQPAPKKTDRNINRLWSNGGKALL